MPTSPTLHITALAIYPVKGLRGIAVEHARVELQGLEHDRRWAIIRPGGSVLTQRELPAMARIDAIPAAAGLRLECAGFGGVDAIAERGACTTVVWGNHVPTVLANQAASGWLERVLETPCSLVYLDDPAARPIAPTLLDQGVVSLADGFPLLVTTTASLAALNEHLGAPVPMERFRPNLVVEGAAGWDEDRWRHIQAGPVRFRIASPCVRCTVTTIDQRSGVATPRKEPLRTLGKLHRDQKGGITFGMNAIPETLGTLSVGGPLLVLQ